MVFALKVRRDRAPVKSTFATLAARAVVMAMVACGGACVGFCFFVFLVCVEIHALGRDASQTGGARHSARSRRQRDTPAHGCADWTGQLLVGV